MAAVLLSQETAWVSSTLIRARAISSQPNPKISTDFESSCLCAHAPANARTRAPRFFVPVGGEEIGSYGQFDIFTREESIAAQRIFAKSLQPLRCMLSKEVIAVLDKR